MFVALRGGGLLVLPLLFCFVSVFLRGKGGGEGAQNICQFHKTMMMATEVTKITMVMMMLLIVVIIVTSLVMMMLMIVTVLMMAAEMAVVLLMEFFFH